MEELRSLSRLGHQKEHAEEQLNGEEQMQVYIAIGRIINSIWVEFVDKGSDTMSRRELQVFMQCFLEFKLKRQEFERLYQNIDQDSSGKIDKIKMVKFALKISGYSSLIKNNHLI